MTCLFSLSPLLGSQEKLLVLITSYTQFWLQSKIRKINSYLVDRQASVDFNTDKTLIQNYSGMRKIKSYRNVYYLVAAIITESSAMSACLKRLVLRISITLILLWQDLRILALGFKSEILSTMLAC